MKYQLLPEFEKYENEFVPIDPKKVRVMNLFLKSMQKDKSPYDELVEKKKIKLPHCSATLFKPKDAKGLSCLVYLHGGAYVLRASATHKNNVKEYAIKANLAVLLVDYRLSPRYKFPLPLEDCYDAYLWALKEFSDTEVYVGGDSAGGNFSLGVTRMALERGIMAPKKLLLVYPVCDTRMNTPSCQEFVDTPMWNASLNRDIYPYYVSEEKLHHPLVSPLEAESFRGFPPTYIETAEFDCLRDEGIMLAKRLEEDGVFVELHNTKGTIHGYDIEEKSEYVASMRQKREEFLASSKP